MTGAAGGSQELNWRPILISAAVAAAMILTTVTCIRRGERASGRPVPAVPEPAAPGEPAAPPAERQVLAVPMFKQWDPAWGDDQLGASGGKMRYVGCTVACVAMTFRHFGIETNPKQLNDWLRRHDGYAARGLLKWEKCVEFAGGRAALDYLGDADHARMRAALAAGRPVIVKVRLESGIHHWLLVVGAEGREYLVNDPLNLSPEPARLSDYGPYLYAMRIFRKAR